MLGGLMSNLPKGVEADSFIEARNVVLSAYGQPRGWRGLGRDYRAAGKLLQVVGTRLAALDNGNVLQSEGNSVWLIGLGMVYLENPDTPIATASSALQVVFNGVAYQGGLPAPPAPVLEIATDATGQAIPGRVQGEISATLVRVRTATGGISADSEPSNVVRFTGNRARIRFPVAAAAAAQDEWILRFTRSGRGAVGGHQTLRRIRETEIAPPHGTSLNTATGNGATTAYQVNSSASVTGLLVALALGGVSAPVAVDSAVVISAGQESSVRLTRSALTEAGYWIVAALTIKQTHQINPNGQTMGTVRPVAVTGAWTQSGSELAPGAETVQLRQDSTTTFQWKLASSGSWSASLAIATTPTALGATGLAVTWSAATSGSDEVNNEWVIVPCAVGAPAGWTLRGVRAATNTATVLAVWTRQTDHTDAQNYDFTISPASQVTLGSMELSGVTGFGQAATAGASGTLHTVTFGVAPAATDTVIVCAAGAGAVTFSPVAPLIERVDSGVVSRSLDFDFSDGDLLDEFAERIYEPPPAGTHLFQTGPVMVVAGTSDGSGLVPSRVNQFEQYDLTLEVFLNPVEPILRVETRPQDGVTFIATRNSLQTVLFTGNDEFPIIPRTIWPQTGIANPSGMCVTLRGVYARSAQGGLVRSSGGEVPDDSFADPVRDILDGWPPEETVLGYDPQEQAVIVACRKEILVFYERNGRWSGLLQVDDFLDEAAGFSFDEAVILSAATTGGHLYLAIGTRQINRLKLYRFHGSVGTTWRLRSRFRHGGAPGFAKTILSVRALADLTSVVPLEYAVFSNTELRQGRLQTTGFNAGGYAASVTSVPKLVLDAESVYWEWDITPATDRLFGVYAKERSILLTALASLTPWGVSPALPGLAYNSASVLVALRIRTNEACEVWKEGVLLGTISGIRLADKLRLEWASGSFALRVLRNGVQVATQVIGAPGATLPAFLGTKLVLTTPGGTISPGVFGRLAPQATLKLARNWNDTARWTRDLRGAGEKWHSWMSPNLRGCQSYQCQIEGRGAGQELTSLLVEYTVTPQQR